jgi:hypothetical protein
MHYTYKQLLLKRRFEMEQVGLLKNSKSAEIVSLKVPKCEIFDCSDFNDFYTIKSLCEGDFVVKIKFFL